MALAYLNEGSTSLAAASWSDATGFAANATLILDKLNAQNITTSVDQSAVAQVNYFKIGNNFSGTIGTASSPLKFGALGTTGNGFYNDASGGTCYFQAANIAGAGSANTIGYYSHSGFARAYISGGAVTQIDQSNGYVEVGQAATCTTVNVGGGEMFIDYNASAGTTLTITGGKVHTKRQFTNIYNYGGTLIQNQTAAITTGVNGPGGIWDHRGGDITTVTIAGSFSVARLDRSCTFTTANTWPTAKFERTTRSTVALTITTETKIAGGASTAGGFTTGGGVGG